MNLLPFLGPYFAPNADANSFRIVFQSVSSNVGDLSFTDVFKERIVNNLEENISVNDKTSVSSPKM